MVPVETEPVHRSAASASPCRGQTLNKPAIKLKTYQIKFQHVFAPSGEGAVDLVDLPEELEIAGTTVQIHSGNMVDYLHVKGVDGSVVFSAETHLIKYCKIKPVQGQLKSIKRKGVNRDVKAVHSQRQDHDSKGANQDV